MSIGDLDAPVEYLGVPIPYNLRVYWDSGYLSIKYWCQGVQAARDTVAHNPGIIESWTTTMASAPDVFQEHH